MIATTIYPLWEKYFEFDPSTCRDRLDRISLFVWPTAEHLPFPVESYSRGLFHLAGGTPWIAHSATFRFALDAWGLTQGNQPPTYGSLPINTYAVCVLSIPPREPSPARSGLTSARSAPCDLCRLSYESQARNTLHLCLIVLRPLTPTTCIIRAEADASLPRRCRSKGDFLTLGPLPRPGPMADYHLPTKEFPSTVTLMGFIGSP